MASEAPRLFASRGAIGSLAVRRSVALVLVVVLGFAVASLAACGDDTKVVTDTGSNGQTTTQTVPDINFAKTKFVLHSGLAFGAFHRYIYKPFKEGKFRSGAPGRRRTFVKAGLAGAFAYHELRVAAQGRAGVGHPGRAPSGPAARHAHLQVQPDHDGAQRRLARFGRCPGR